MKIKILILLMWVSVTYASVCDKHNPQQESNTTLPWYGYAQAWLEIDRPITDPELRKQKIDTLKEMVRFFFSVEHLVTQGTESKIYIEKKDLEIIGKFLYQMTAFYEKHFSERPWGIVKISSPIDKDHSWQYVIFRIFNNQGLNCMLHVTFYPKDL